MSVRLPWMPAATVAWVVSVFLAVAALAQDQGTQPRLASGPEKDAERLEKIEKRVSDIEARFGRTMQPVLSVNTVEKRLQRIEQTLSQMETRLDQLDQRVKRLEAKR